MTMKSITFKSIAPPLTALALMLGGPALAQETPTTPTAPAPTEPVMPAPAAPDAAPGGVMPGAAVTDAPAGFVPPEGYRLLPDWGGITAESLKGATVAGPDGASIGTISDVEISVDGTADGLIADIGGFLGIGSHTVKLGGDQVSLYQNDDGDVIAHSVLTKDALKALPEYNVPG